LDLREYGRKGRAPAGPHPDLDDYGVELGASVDLIAEDHDR
jgi:hypothetical protein